jgi:hypothetical protein
MYEAAHDPRAGAWATLTLTLKRHSQTSVSGTSASEAKRAPAPVFTRKAPHRRVNPTCSALAQVVVSMRMNEIEYTATHTWKGELSRTARIHVTLVADCLLKLLMLGTRQAKDIFTHNSSVYS